jgi:transposase
MKVDSPQPGEKIQVDFSDGVWLTERATGKKTLTQLFLGVLPFSSHVFGEFVLDQKLPTFIGLHERSFELSEWRSAKVHPDCHLA